MAHALSFMSSMPACCILVCDITHNDTLTFSIARALSPLSNMPGLKMPQYSSTRATNRFTAGYEFNKKHAILNNNTK
jgi:hypothetical protein